MANHIRVIGATATGVFATAMEAAATDANNQLTALIAANLPGTVNIVDHAICSATAADGINTVQNVLVLVQYVG